MGGDRKQADQLEGPDGRTRQLNFYRLTVDEVEKQLDSSRQGLKASEAAERLQQQGPNALEVKRRESWFSAYMRQFKDLMIVLLMVSGALSFILQDYRAGSILFTLVLFNTVIGFVQEFKAEKLVESLEKLVVAQASVMRDGKLVEVPSADLVMGDLVYVEEGNSVPADIRLVSEEELSTNDFALTGESQPTRKFIHAISADVPLANRQNIAYMGTTVATGRGYGYVVGTGTYTELGRIASLSQSTKRVMSPLQKEMTNIATTLTKATIMLCSLLLPVAIHAGLEFKDAILFAIAIASSVIPQGLPAEINTALTRAAGRLARSRALVKKLSAVETLGATSVIATDKTGTLTKNQMTVERFMVGKTTYTVTGKGYEPAGGITTADGKPLDAATLEDLKTFFAAGALASNAKINPPDTQHAVWYCIGDPTEGAVVTLAAKAGVNPVELDAAHPELKEFSFDSARKLMSSVRDYAGGNGQKRLYLFVKGAPENVLERCNELWDHGHSRKLTKTDRKQLTDANEDTAESAMRNLAFAYRILPPEVTVENLKDFKLEAAEQDLTWLGTVSMIDPLREDVPEAMVAAREAHIKVSIITGDNAITAKAIAIRAGLVADPADITVVSGEELQKLSDSQVLQLAERGGTIFSRVAPEDKLRVVGLVQNSGRVVAVTGDGINDAPALKRADIGVAMGRSGTDVAKQSAEIILLDDSFNTLVKAVQQGRTIYQNIQKATLSCFTSNAAELVVNLASLVAASTMNIPLALSVMQILAVDLIAELFPLASLGADKADGDLMRDKPRPQSHHILNARSIRDLLFCGLLIGGLAFVNYLWFFERHNVNPIGLDADSLIHYEATSLTYLTIVFCQLSNILQRRSRHGLFTRYQFHNRALWLSIAFSLFCVANIIYNPWIYPYFKAGPLSFVDVMFAVGACVLFIAIREFQRTHRLHNRREEVVELHKATVGSLS